MANLPVNEVAISLPFTIDDFGSVANTTSQTKIWADRVRSAMGTALDERVFVQNYGTTIPTTLFESVDQMTSAIEDQATEVFARDLPLLTLVSVTATYNQSADTVYAEIEYELPNKEQTSVTIGIASISSDSPLTEEIL